MNHPPKVNPHNPIPVFQGHAFNVTSHGHACVVDEKIDAAQPTVRGVLKSLNRAPVRYIRGYRDGISSVGFD